MNRNIALSLAIVAGLGFASLTWAGEHHDHAGKSKSEHAAHAHAGESEAEHAKHAHAGESEAEHAKHAHAGESEAEHAAHASTPSSGE